MNPNPTSRFRNLASTVIILILLLGVLAFYYFKYVPERQKEFNRNAFLELSQIETALQAKSTGYLKAFETIIGSDSIAADMLKEFNYKPALNKHIDADDVIRPSYFERDSMMRWNMVYDIFDPPDEADNNPKNDSKEKSRNDSKGKSSNKSNNKPNESSNAYGTRVCTLSKDADELMSGLVSTYHDIFDGYFVICSETSLQTAPISDDNKTKDTSKWLSANIIFHSTDFGNDYLVNADSLLRRNVGVSTMNILDVTIAGNPYKLFLYPFEMGRQKLTFAGIISESNYREANLKIPFSIFTVFAVLLLLLIIHLPILRIYVLSADERIRALDIRLIIGSYFIAAFFGFFLFSKIFLDREQSIQNKIHLESMAAKIKANLYDELGKISRQLTAFDSTFMKLSKESTIYRWAMSNRDPGQKEIDSLNRLFKDTIYPYADAVFWINESGKWVARWSLRQSQTKSKMISVKDRAYFKDFKISRFYSIPEIDSFTIQPTLAKLEGEYIITVVKKSHASGYIFYLDGYLAIIKPYLIGLSSRMHSVSGIIMPPGYGFSMIDGDGNILFDSKEGRPLLSNILKETEDPDGIQQSANYRNTRYFEHLLLRNKNMALLSTPVQGTPYQLLVYYNQFRSDSFQEHLVALSAGLIGIVICLVLFCGLVNQWSKTKNRVLESRAPHFEWLYPSTDPLKHKYYRHLIKWMLLLLAIYLLAWFIMDIRMPGAELSMLFISLLFPFYVAIHYYELRERYYDVSEKRTGVNWYFSRPSLALRILLLFFILIINCFVPFYKLSGRMALPVLITQFAWAFVILRSEIWFRKYLNGEKISGIPACGDFPPKPAQPTNNKIPRSYVWSILTGVALISVIPAFGIFWVFFREETGLYQNADQLIMANRVDQRRQEINKYLRDYKFRVTDSLDRTKISELKFEHGIYSFSAGAFPGDSGIIRSSNHYPSADYIRLHEWLIPSDSISWAQPADSAADGSWFFGEDKMNKYAGPVLVFSNKKDQWNPTPFHLMADGSAGWNTVELMAHSFGGNGATFTILFLLGIAVSVTAAYFLTLSLSKRIFLRELHLVTSQFNSPKNWAGKIYAENQLSRKVKLIMLKTCRQIMSLSDDKSVKAPINFPDSPDLWHVYHFEKRLPMRMLEATMPALVKTLAPVYNKLWSSLDARKKFLLFDFAQDGFANYKASKDLQRMTEQGLLFFDDQRLSMVTLSFQEYVLQQKDDKQLKGFLATSGKQGTWKNFRTPLFILLAAVGIFIFVTQDAIYQKITGLIASLTSLVPLLTNLFNKPGGKSGDA
jgi:hypothetical protein